MKTEQGFFRHKNQARLTTKALMTRAIINRYNLRVCNQTSNLREGYYKQIRRIRFQRLLQGWKLRPPFSVHCQAGTSFLKSQINKIFATSRWRFWIWDSEIAFSQWFAAHVSITLHRHNRPLQHIQCLNLPIIVTTANYLCCLLAMVRKANATALLLHS